MNDNTIETIMRSYAHSAVSDKKQDLQKFHLTQTQPHHSSAPMKRRLAWIGLCVFVIATFCVSIYLSQQTPEPLWDLDAQEFASFHAGKYQIPADRTQTLAECISESPEIHREIVPYSLLPHISCTDITVYKLYRRFDGIVGMAGVLTPASGNIRKAAVSYYFNTIPENREIIEMKGYAALPNTAVWEHGQAVSYSDPLTTEDGTMYKVFFEDNKFYCCLDIYAPENMEITDLLTELFN